MNETLFRYIKNAKLIQVGVKILYIVDNKHIFPHININTTLLHLMNLPEVKLNKLELLTIMDKGFLNKKLCLPEGSLVVISYNNVRVGVARYVNQRLVKGL